MKDTYKDIYMEVVFFLEKDVLTFSENVSDDIFKPGDGEDSIVW